MRIVTYDGNFTWDDQNTYWGNPSYQLEPGDPGYIAPPGSTLSSNPKPRKTKKMPKSDYIEANDDEFAAQLTTLQNGLPGQAAMVGVTPAQVTAQAADADYFNYVMECLHLADNYSKQWVAWKDLVRDGGTPPPGGAPLALVLPTAVPAVALGVEPRTRDLAQGIKGDGNYNTGIGQALGIEGQEIAGPDLATIKPVLKATGSGGAVKIGWGWQGQRAFLDMIELQVDRGAGYQMLAMDTTPNYTDSFEPTAPAKWKYRGIYRVGDDRVGQWSDEVSISVAP